MENSKICLTTGQKIIITDILWDAWHVSPAERAAKALSDVGVTLDMLQVVIDEGSLSSEWTTNTFNELSRIERKE